MKKQYYVYILRCVDDTLYTGYTLDIDRRVTAHEEGKGARYTRSRLPVKLVYVEKQQTLGEALSREHQIKQLSHKEKERLIASGRKKQKRRSAVDGR